MGNDGEVSGPQVGTDGSAADYRNRVRHLLDGLGRSVGPNFEEYAGDQLQAGLQLAQITATLSVSAAIDQLRHAIARMRWTR